MSAKIFNYYKLSFDDDGYINGFCAVDGNEYDFYGQMSDHLDVCDGWTKCINGQLIEDATKKAEIIAEREAEAKKPTWEETIESQVMWTALMTDTVVESGEE